MDLWQELELASELDSHLWDTVNWGNKWLVDFNAGKTQLVLFDQSYKTGAIDVKIYGSILEEKSSFKMLGLTFPSKLDWGSYIISVAKTTPLENGSLDSLYEVSFSWRFSCLSINTVMHGILLACLGWCSYLLLGIVR